MSFLSRPDVRSAVATAIFLITIVTNFQIGRSAVPGTLTPDYGNGLPISTDIGGGDVATAMVLRADGKAIVAGTVNQASTPTAAQDFYWARFEPDGTLEGSVTTDFATSVDTAADIAMQPDGKTVIVGSTAAPGGGQPSMAIARYLTNGNLDTNFDTDGKLTFLDGTSSQAGAVAIQPDGKIIVLGNSFSGGVPKAIVLRLNTDGSPDNGFGTSGLVTIPGSLQVVGTGVALRQDGRITLSIYSANSFMVARLMTNGALDATFDGDGIVMTDFDGGIEGPFAGVAIMQDNRIVVGGLAATSGGPNRMAVARYMQNGSLDTTFDGDGKAVAPYPGATPSAGNDMVVQTDGKVVLLGFAFGVGATSVRFNADGTMDNTYGAAGFSFAPSASNSIFSACVLYGDSILAAGSVGSFGATNTYMGKIALTPDAPSPADFDGDGRADLSTFRPSNGGWYVLNSRTNTFTASFFGTTGDIPVDADLDGDRRNDLVVFRPSTGTWHTQKSSTGAYAPINWGANGDKAVAADYDKDGRTDIAVWRPSSGIYYVLRSSDNAFFITQWGGAGDIPIGGSPQ